MNDGLRGLGEGREMEVNFSGGGGKGLVAVAVKERVLRVKRGGEKRRVVADMAPAGRGRLGAEQMWESVRGKICNLIVDKTSAIGPGWSFESGLALRKL